MALPASGRLGSYEIVAPLGAGGMGEVYRARDTRLKRDVALKILPEAFAQDPERMARFEREAQVLAALNHPNIAQIYGVEGRALIMELVEGQTLTCPLPLNVALAYARQIAGALEYAHEKGIVHRDLKPTNIMVTSEGVLKLLDFGLAKATDELSAGGGGDPSLSPTLTLGATRAGVIMGTAAYMAPEQARGHAVDRRADIFSFGAVLYEVLSGKRAFEGESATDTLAAVLKVDPDWDALPSATPPPVRKLIQWCLKKDRKQRLQAIGDARLLLDEEQLAPITEPPRLNRWFVAALAVSLGVAAWGWLRPQPERAPDPRFVLTIAPPKGVELPPVGSQVGAPLLSPDGAYLLSNDLLRNMNSLRMDRLSGVVVGAEPFWSADSKWVALPSSGGLQKMRIPDGAPEPLTLLPSSGAITRGGAWSDDGTILISAADAGVWSLYLLPKDGALRRVAVPGLASGRFFHPEFLPGGPDFLAAFRPAGSAMARIYLATLRDGLVVNPVMLMENETAAHYTPAGGGRILFVRNDNLYAQKLNLKDRRLEGDPILIQPGVASAPGLALADFSVSRSGLVAWRPGTRAYSQVTMFDRQGKPVGTAGPPSEFNYLRLAPDEAHLLGSGIDRDPQLLELGAPGQLALGEVAWFVWSPDGSRLLGRRGSQIVEAPVARPAEVHPLVEAPGINFLEDVSPDGKVALYSRGDRSVLAIDVNPGGRPSSVVQTGEQIVNPRFSPDGHWIVYAAGPLGSRSLGVFVQPFPGPGLRRQISSNGNMPIWRKDGKEIIYMTIAPHTIWSIPIGGSSADPHFGQPVQLFAAPAELNLVIGRTALAVTRDGSRILFPQAVEQPEDSNVIHVKMGWADKPR